MTAGLSIENLVASHGRTQVLHEVSLTIAPRALACVIGPSGCGKTTLLRAIAGFHRPDGGRIILSGTEIDGPGAHVRSEARRIGYIPQNVALFPHLSVADNIGFGLPRRDRADRVAELLQLIGLQSLGKRQPHELSGGQQQRVALARALAPRPDLLLLDEPFSALDAELRHRVRTDVAALLRASGTTAVLVTHDAAEALDFAEHVTVLESGTVQQSDAVAEVYFRPVNTVVARALGDATVLDAVVEAGQARTALGQAPLDSPGLPDGSACEVLIRPRQLSLATEASAGAMSATVVSCQFQTYRTEISVPGLAQPITVDADRVHAVGSTAFVSIRGPLHPLAR